MVDEALGAAGVGLRDLAAVAVTGRPGLIGALLVGLSTAKALAAAAGLPFVAVDHLHGHVAANYSNRPARAAVPLPDRKWGTRCLRASSDTTDTSCSARLRDDAAGEALDKGARLMGLGYPGGAAIDRLARQGDAGAFDFPLGMQRGSSLDFSFSGLKTALVYKVRISAPNRHSLGVPTWRRRTSGRWWSP